MTIDQLRDAVERNKDKGDDALALTAVGTSMRGLGVRPQILAENGDGTKIYGFTLKQVRKLIRIYEGALS